jgi:ribosomal-protein-alanine N-acetyltransferase
MIIRRAGERDTDAVHRVLEQLMHAEGRHRAEVWSRLLSDPAYKAWVAEADHQVVGFLDVVTWPDIGHGNSVGLVNNLVVDERRRGQGVGTRLLQEAIRHCKSEGIVELHVWTDENNTQALRLYKNVGFVNRGLLLERQL